METQMPNFYDPITPGEEQQIGRLVQLIMDRQKQEHQPGTLARRAFHAKSHGVVHGTFTVRKLIPDDMRVGIFAQATEYEALVRFSNGNGGPHFSDARPNVRGFALKLKGVPGEKLLPGEENSTEQDFIFANDDRFFFSSLEEMLYLSENGFAKLALRYPGAVWRILRATMKVVKNPLFIDYDSQVPYRIGNFACKWRLTPIVSPSAVRWPDPFDANYFRHSIESSLRMGAAHFLFSAQLKSAFDSILDPHKRWQGEFGWPGRARLVAYKTDFDWRKQENAQSGQ
jgi:hypothetical protein